MIERHLVLGSIIAMISIFGRIGYSGRDGTRLRCERNMVCYKITFVAP